MRKFYIFLNMTLVFLILLSNIPQSTNAEEVVDFEEKLTSITEEEKTIIQDLFILLQEIEGLERDYTAISKEVEILRQETFNLESRIEVQEEKYNKNLLIMEDVLKSYQRMGPASYLEILLDSENISDFLRRINIIRDLSRNTGDLLDTIEETRDSLEKEKVSLDEKLSLIKERQRQLEDTLNQKEQVASEQEAYLRSLEADREYFEMYLGNLSEMMLRLEDLFELLKEKLPDIIVDSNISLEELNPKLSLQGIKLTIGEDLFNEILGGDENLPYIEFEFTSKNIEMLINEYDTRLVGSFSNYQGHAIEFSIEEVKFYEFVLEEKTVKDLIGDSILFDFEGILDGSSIKNIEIFDEYMELTISLF